MKISRIGLVLGPAVFAVLLILPSPVGMEPAAQRTAAVALLMVIWWVTEALPIPATSLIPLVAYPLLGILPIDATAANYADPNVFLFMGGFLIALCMQKWGLHRRIALGTVRLLGGGLRTLVLGFMVATALLSMWISNTATVMMMLPIAIAVLDRLEGEEHAESLGLAIMLGIAYAASVGGMGTLIGTPPNIALAGTVRRLSEGGAEIGFVQWMAVGLPMVVLLVPLIWIYLVKWAAPLPRGARPAGVDGRTASPGKLGRGEKIAAAAFVLVALGWILRQPLLQKLWPGMTDAVVAMAVAIVLFAVPVDWRRGRFAMDWEQARKLPWGILLLFGGGFALAAGMDESGLAAWLSDRLVGLSELPTFLVVLLTCLFMAALTELTSNTATTYTLLPVLAATAEAMDIQPLTLMVPATLAASCAFMLPVATPPNAIVFSSGRVRMGQMFRAGIWVNLMGVLLATLVACTLGQAVFDGGGP